MTQPDLLSWRPAEEPTPTPEKFKRAKGDPRDYRAELRGLLDARPDLAQWFADEAVACVARGDERISVKALIEDARRRFRVSLNNSYMAALSDHLCSLDEQIAARVERRARRTTR